jgi:endonuclease-3 related protein
MPRAKVDSLSGSARRLRRMHDWLAEAYGPQHWWPAETTFEVVIGAYLTQNTSWKAVEQSLTNLRASGVLTIDGIRRISISDLQDKIRPSGFYTRKAPSVKAFVAMLDAEFGGSLELLAATPTDLLRKRLLDLPGVGFETADAILLYALGHAVPVADEYFRRVVERHRILKNVPRKNRKGYGSLVELTREAFAQDPAWKKTHLFGEFHALIVAVGKAHCAKHADCTGCPLARDPHRKMRI